MIGKFPRALLFIIVAAFLLRIALLFLIMSYFGQEALFVSDAGRFYKIAQALVIGHGFTLGEAPYVPSAFFPPVFLSLLGGSLALTNSVMPVILLHIILGSLLPLVVWRISGFITEDHKARFLASGFSAFEPQMILWSIVPTTEMIAAFTMLCAMYFFFKTIEKFEWQNAAFSGLFLGISTLTRPHSKFLFFLGLALLFWYFFREKNKKVAISLAIFAAVFILTLSPWLIRNYYHFRTFSVSTTGLRNIYSDYAVAVESLRTGTPFGEERKSMYKDLSEKLGVSPEDVRENPAFSRAVAREGISIILSHPKESIEVLLIALNAFFTQDLYTFYLDHFHAIPEIKFDFSPSAVLIRDGPVQLFKMIWGELGVFAALPALARIFWVLLDFLAILGGIMAFKKKGMPRIGAIIILFVVLYYAATSAVGAFSDQGRLRYPVNSFIFILASIGLLNLASRGKDMRWADPSHNFHNS